MAILSSVLLVSALARSHLDVAKAGVCDNGAETQLVDSVTVFNYIIS